MSKQFWITVIAMVVSAFIGYYANVYANKQNNTLLVQLLKDQLACVNGKIMEADLSQGRVDQATINQLNQQRLLLEQQLYYYSQKFGIS